MKNDEMELKLCISEDQVTNIFIKPLKTDVFEKLKITLSVIDFVAQFNGDCWKYNMTLNSNLKKH